MCLSTMRLHLFRHGEAVAKDDPAVTRDAERPLTEEGRRQVRGAATGMAALGVQPDRAMASPYARARQTAKAAREAFDPAPEMGELHELRPEADPADARLALDGLDDGESVLLCGHRPHLPRLTSYLLTGDRQGLDIDFPKASLVTIEIPLATPEALGQLANHIPADALRRLGSP